MSQTPVYDMVHNPQACRLRGVIIITATRYCVNSLQKYGPASSAFITKLLTTAHRVANFERFLST